MADNYPNSHLGPDAVVAPAVSGVAVTPHATNPLTNVPRALYVGGAGDIACRFVNDSADVTIVGVAAGSVLPFRIAYVRVSGTTATNIVALY